MKQILKATRCNSLEDLLGKIGSGALSIQNVIKVVQPEELRTEEAEKLVEQELLSIAPHPQRREKPSSDGIIIEGVDDIDDSKMKHKIPVVAMFQSQRGKEYTLSFKEMSTKADASTQTFSVTYTMPKPQGVIILPGMTAMVKVDLSKLIVSDTDFYLPVSAVVADVALQGTVWVVDEKTMEVESKIKQLEKQK